MSNGQEERYRITFLGPVRNDITNVNKLAQGLKALFRLSDEAVTRVMKMAPVVIKKEVTLTEARQYKEALEAIGAKVQLEPVESAPAEEAQGQQQQEEEGSSSLDREPQVIPVKGKPSSPSPETAAPEEKTGPQMIKCPQCGFEQVATDECTKCGVIISKFLKYQTEVKPVEPEGGAPGPAENSTAGPQPQKMIGTPMDGPSSSVPWEDMASLGFLTAFFRTMKQVLFSPTEFFKNMPVSKGMGSPLLYGVIITFFPTIVGLLVQYALSGSMGNVSETEGMQGVNFFQPVTLLISALFLPIILAVGFFILSAIFHICLLIVGAGKQGFEATFRVVTYAGSSQIFALVPFVGGLIIFFYNLVLGTIGFREAHRTTTGRAFIAVILPVAIMLFLIALIAFAIIIPLLFSQGQPMIEQQPQSF